MEIRVFGLVLLLVICASLPAEAQTWRDFKWKHIDSRMVENNCEKVMNRMKLPQPNANPNNCKEVNSFIRATDKLVIDVCTGAGRSVGGKLYESDLPFSVVTCTGNSNQRYPNCKYRGNRSMRKITLTCENDLPVHYHEDEVVVG
ncbi:hypothetical protein PHYPO_G00162460 [Pangasianodon hypophthalmus]|uniref:Ribonuclease A-domain domain-containing protein n=1 Tax=Pangasianodon hypophthalmus TaxID=310915 RepID=A0A5N5K683_PANHP|nr:hypothetical protein PHYPO_G00162460 [Pangasianodon hypophthalmus]